MEFATMKLEKQRLNHLRSNTIGYFWKMIKQPDDIRMTL